MAGAPIASASSWPRALGDRPKVTFWESASFTAAHAVASGLLLGLGLSGLYRFARLFGTLEWLINFKRRRRFGAALEEALGRRPTPTERRRHTREFFMRTRCDKLFYLILDRIPRKRATRLLDIGNQPVLDEAVGRGRGVYVALSHHGPQHVIAMLFALRGYKTAGVRDRNEGAIRRFVQQRLDQRYPDLPKARMLFADSYPREIYRCLQDGYVLGSAMDVHRPRDPQQTTEEVVIFGQTRRFPSGPLRIALRCRCPALQAFIIPQRDFRYRLEIVGTLLDPDRIDNEPAAVAQAMRTYAANVERQVRAQPSLLSRI